MNIFKQMYTVRRYKGTSWGHGTSETAYTDVQFPLDVQAKHAGIRTIQVVVRQWAF